MSRRQLLGLLLTASALAACGRRGDLRLPERSPPPPEEAGEDDSR